VPRDEEFSCACAISSDGISVKQFFNHNTSPFPGGSVYGGHGGHGGHGGYVGNGVSERFNGTSPLGIVATVPRLLSYLVSCLIGQVP
jgi:hypothetical protein